MKGERFPYNSSWVCFNGSFFWSAWHNHKIPHFQEIYGWQTVALKCWAKSLNRSLFVLVTSTDSTHHGSRPMQESGPSGLSSSLIAHQAIQTFFVHKRELAQIFVKSLYNLLWNCYLGFDIHHPLSSLGLNHHYLHFLVNSPPALCSQAICHSWWCLSQETLRLNGWLLSVSLPHDK